MDGIFPQRAYHLLSGVIELNPSQILERDLSNVIVIDAATGKMPDIGQDSPIRLCGTFHDGTRRLNRADIAPRHDLQHDPRTVLRRFTAKLSKAYVESQALL